MKRHVKFTTSWVLTKIIEVLECEQHERYAVCNTWHFVCK